MYKEKWKNYYFPTKPLPNFGKWGLLRKVAADQLTPSAQLKLEWIISYHTLFAGSATKTAAHFGISRKTFHKWLGKFDGRNLKSLEEESKAPKTKRDWMVTLKEEGRIVSLRKKNMEFGKKKLKTIYKREHGEIISTWKIERVIRKHNLFPDKVKHQYQVEKGANLKAKPKIRIHEVKEAIREVREFGFLWHIDAIIIWWYGTRRVIFTALEEVTNNGSEFEGSFEKACLKLSSTQFFVSSTQFFEQIFSV